MQSHQARLLKTAASIQDWPIHDKNEIIFVGRSNSGKSTLINALCNRKQLAYAGKTPGKTRLLNFFMVDEQIVFTDAPGYGYATSDKASAIAFANLIDPYFSKRDQLKAMILVCDLRRTPSQDDIAMIEYGRANHLAIFVVCTKMDKLKYGQQMAQKQLIAKTLNVSENALILVDGNKKVGIDEVWNKLTTFYLAN